MEMFADTIHSRLREMKKLNWWKASAQCVHRVADGPLVVMHAIEEISEDMDLERGDRT